jgi:apolipoprotein N-acyltransferase
MKGKEFWTACVLSALSGVLLTVGFPALQFHHATWVALIPLFFALRGKGAKDALFLGYVCGLFHNFTVLFWIRYVIHHYGGLPFPVAISILLLLCAYLAVYPACFAFFAQWWKPRPLLWTFGLPCVWVVLEFVRAYAVTGFPWANLGYTQTPFSHLIQFADITGVYGVGWLVVLGNTVLMACIDRGRSLMRPVMSLTALAACILAALVYGTVRVKEVAQLQEKTVPFQVAVVQGNIDQSQKWNPAFQQETLRRYRELSLKAASGDPVPELLVWPETAVPFFYGTDEKLTTQLTGIFQEIGKPLLFGSPAVTRVNGEMRFQNRAYLVDGNALTLGKYAKQHLVPFGEYVPLQKLLFFVNRLVEFAGDFVPGAESSPIPLHGQSLGVLICYEGIFPELAREAVSRGATAFVNITNDAWYGPTSAPYQHMEIARWRAIEFRRPLIRAANTGISTLVDAAGNLCGTIALNQQGYLACGVRPVKVKTFYAEWGNLFVWLCVLATGLGVLICLRRKALEERTGIAV